MKKLPDNFEHPFCSLTEEQYHTLKSVADTLFVMTDNKNPNETDRRFLAIENSLAFLCGQLDSVLDSFTD